MRSGKSGCLCPLSLGLALGITLALSFFCGAVWMLYHGVPPLFATQITTPFTWPDVFVFTLIGLVKGFIFGVVLALFYDLFYCMTSSRCRKGGCECGPACKCNGSCSCCGATTNSVDIDRR
ncbi:MAG: hypothetical protein H0W64_08000 [Gammaproteobacteria bacterium]|nr:hypothetical protein [Gammaproteobacteria bacterium]